MKVAPLPGNEAERLSELYSYDILDTLPDDDYDHITRIASEICDTPIALIGLIDADRQWYKSQQGLKGSESSRDLSFCSHAILNPDEIMVVPNSSMDERFADNPNVLGEPHVVFYAGVPLVSENGFSLGTLCVVDNKPKTLTESQKQSLRALGRQVVVLMDLRKKNRELAVNREEMNALNLELERFAHVVAHDLKSPCNNLIGLSDLLLYSYQDKLDDDGKEMLGHLQSVSLSLKQLIDDILEDSRSVHFLAEGKEEVNLPGLIDEIIPLLTVPSGFSICYDNEPTQLNVSKTALVQILLNLLSNAIKYNDKAAGTVDIKYWDDEVFYYFSVTDNGPGIPAASFHKIFESFQTLDQKDRFDQSGHGIGLHTVKKLVTRLGGEVKVSSDLGSSATFEFSIRK
jgi:signal transduction histidine kinase